MPNTPFKELPKELSKELSEELSKALSNAPSTLQCTIKHEARAVHHSVEASNVNLP